MTLQKGAAKINLKKSTQARLDQVRKHMETCEPDKYDESTSYNAVVTWLIDDYMKHHQKEINQL